MPDQPDAIVFPLTPPQVVDATRGELWRGHDDKAGVCLAHGAGSTLDHPVGRAFAAGLAAAGHPVLTFDFAYSRAGRRRPYPAPRLLAAWRDAVEAFRSAVDDRPVVLGGRSMGGRMASMLVADGHPAAGLVLLGYPLHPPDRPDRLRVDHWPDVGCPVLFLSGDRDRLCDLDLLARHRPRLADSALHVLTGADHGFGVRRRDGRTTGDVIAEAVATAGFWIDRHVRNPPDVAAVDGEVGPNRSAAGELP